MNMTYVIDTHIFLWLLFEPHKFSTQKMAVLKNPHHRLVMTDISFWEICIKYNLGKLSLYHYLPEELPKLAEQMGIEVVKIDTKTMANFYQLPKFKEHKDPFDRLVIWHCICQRLPLVSEDGKFDMYVPFGLTTV